MDAGPRRTRARLWAWAYAVVFEPDGSTSDETPGEPTDSSDGDDAESGHERR